MSCWGQIEPKEHNIRGTFKQISSGNFHACALEASGDLKCFGKNDSNECVTPKGPYVQVSCGLHQTCALRRNGSVECWGKNDVGQSNPPRKIVFKEISVGSKGHACGLSLEGNVVCWGDNSHGQAQTREGE